MTVKNKLMAILDDYDYPYYLQGTVEEGNYPESFFTFWNTDSYDQSFYDNSAHRHVYVFTLYFYSTDPDLVNAVLLEAKEDFEGAGWIVRGKGYDVPSDDPSYTGRAIELTYIEIGDEVDETENAQNEGG